MRNADSRNINIVCLISIEGVLFFLKWIFTFIVETELFNFTKVNRKHLQLLWICIVLAAFLNIEVKV